MNKPTKPNITIPEGFAANGIKADFDNNKILNGFDRIRPNVLAADNLNKFIDDTYKASNYGIKGVDYLEERWKSQLTNCILEAPNGVATFSGSNITLKQGLKMLYSNGRNIDKTLKNGELTLDSDTILDLSSYSGQTFDFELMFGCNINDSYLSQNYQESAVAPSNFSDFNQIYLNTTENQMYFYVSSSSSWEKRTMIKLGKGKLENGVVTSFTPYQPVELLKQSDKSQISSWGFPSNRYIDLELGASGSTYTAPANGWFWIQKLSSSTVQYLTPAIKGSNGNIKYILTSQPTSVGYDAEILAPVSKGDVIIINYSVGGATKFFRFVYAEGSN